MKKILQFVIISCLASPVFAQNEAELIAQCTVVGFSMKMEALRNSSAEAVEGFDYMINKFDTLAVRKHGSAAAAKRFNEQYTPNFGRWLNRQSQETLFSLTQKCLNYLESSVSK